MPYDSYQPFGFAPLPQVGVGGFGWLPTMPPMPPRAELRNPAAGQPIR